MFKPVGAGQHIPRSTADAVVRMRLVGANPRARISGLEQLPGKLVELASLLGHESLDTTVVYTRPSSEELAQDLERSHLNVDG